MWKLKHAKKDHIEKYVFVDEEFIVGRKDASLLIVNDPSVSRRHAVLIVKHPKENLHNPARKSSLFVRDEKSKYGTFKNGLRISTEVELVAGDVIKFGQFESEFRIHMQPLVIASSCLELPGRKELKKTIHNLGGNLIAEWQPSCTHLVMPQIKVTVKALFCLVSCIPIVTPEYFQKLKKSLQSESSFLSPKEFMPSVEEHLINKDEVSFHIDPRRKVLFKNKTFYFIDEKQFKKLHLGITLGGGHATILTKDTIDLKMLLLEGACVIEPDIEVPSQEDGNFFNKIDSLLKKKGLRMIAESDIGLAVAYCSTEKFCNPKFIVEENSMPQKLQSQSLTQREMYVPDTEQHLNSKEQKTMNTGEEIFGSLHLSSVNKEATEGMEIPLSVQVKQEFDLIFGDLVENEPEKIDIPPPTSPKFPPARPQKRAATNTQRETSHIKEVQSPKENDKVKKPRIKSEVPQASPPERLPLNIKNNSVDDPKTTIQFEVDLPRNLMKIEYTSLICHKPAPVVQVYRNSSVKNFKKFKKVQPKKIHVLPRIIGAHELMPYDKATIFNEVWEESEKVPSHQPIRGEFDWDVAV